MGTLEQWIHKIHLYSQYSWERNVRVHHINRTHTYRGLVTCDLR